MCELEFAAGLVDMLFDRIRVLHVSGGSRWARPERLVALLVLSYLAGITPLAHASLPDPTWVPGVYDDADHDEEIALLTCATALSDAPPAPGEPARPLLRIAPFASVFARPHAPPLDFHLRSPPTT